MGIPVNLARSRLILIALTQTTNPTIHHGVRKSSRKVNKQTSTRMIEFTVQIIPFTTSVLLYYLSLGHQQYPPNASLDKKKILPLKFAETIYA